MHIQDKNKFNNYQYRKRGGIGHNMATDFDCHLALSFIILESNKKYIEVDIYTKIVF